ncbi:tRNA pseudouridine(55) synthase TruB [Coralloluteibacterium stylophorae]|uniref:tRNA pseudouridine synthase B n=1 Tax=Coralloluteibacterium stylophorae TaxID=1776034 RepID=A0A8J7VVJ0_9GAMM|nr:tRNA pseudouridine(55) synthase TruB [Coralloluteibacterium stylophorae]MBS7457582.1 tRNA pseudouridine(55) synthase TruB [Coralloluteibacterium stylophorae]
MTPRTRTVFRELDGIVLLDKPQGMSSNQALQRARHLFRAAKAGHTGSLDPLATGLLPLCFGEATKLAGGLLGARKAYRTVAVLGRTTDTDDADGATLRERAVPALGAQAVEDALVPLRGRIRQRPPIYSALKQGGEPLYAKARRGEAIEVAEREVEVHRLECLALEHGRVELEIECGSGTYVRSLVRDLGEALGCGAHVAVLRRLWVDPFRAPAMVTLDALRALAEREGRDAVDVHLLPLDAGLVAWPRLQLDAAAARRFAQGQRFRLPDAQGPVEADIVVLGADARALGFGRLDKTMMLRPQRLFRWAALSAAAG